MKKDQKGNFIICFILREVLFFSLSAYCPVYIGRFINSFGSYQTLCLQTKKLIGHFRSVQEQIFQVASKNTTSVFIGARQLVTFQCLERFAVLRSSKSIDFVVALSAFGECDQSSTEVRLVGRSAMYMPQSDWEISHFVKWLNWHFVKVQS